MGHVIVQKLSRTLRDKCFQFLIKLYDIEKRLEEFMRQRFGSTLLVIATASFASAQDIPSGAVMAFDLQECPAGWMLFDKGAGRFVLGTSEAFAFGSEGGEATHRLTVEEMPSHSHGDIVGGDGGTAGMLNDYAYHSSGFRPIKPSGGNRPHNNMPPYIALTLCRKM